MPVGGIRSIEEPIFTKACKHKTKHKQKMVFWMNKFEVLIEDFFEIMKKIG